MSGRYRISWAETLIGTGGVGAVIGALGLAYSQVIQLDKDVEMSETVQCQTAMDLLKAADPFSDFAEAQRIALDNQLSTTALRCLGEEILK